MHRVITTMMTKATTVILIHGPLSAPSAPSVLLTPKAHTRTHRFNSHYPCEPGFACSISRLFRDRYFLIVFETVPRRLPLTWSINLHLRTAFNQSTSFLTKLEYWTGSSPNYVGYLCFSISLNFRPHYPSPFSIQFTGFHCHASESSYL